MLQRSVRPLNGLVRHHSSSLLTGRLATGALSQKRGDGLAIALPVRLVHDQAISRIGGR